MNGADDSQKEGGEAVPRTERIIDSDAHVFEPQDIWLRYLDASLREVVTSIPGLENWQQHEATMARRVVSIGVHS